METAAQLTEHVYATASLLALEFAWPEMTGGQTRTKLAVTTFVLIEKRAAEQTGARIANYLRSWS